MITVSAIVATFGSDEWRVRAECAVGSLYAQTIKPYEIIAHHGLTLAEARNSAAMAASGDYLFFLDADDIADGHYIEAMTAALERAGAGEWLCQPATLGWYGGDKFDDEPVLIGPTRLIESNYLVIGTLISRSLFHRIGGFGEYDSHEDWELFLRAVLAGAEVVAVPEAVYVVRVGPGRNTDQAAARRCFREIRRKHAEAFAEFERSRA